MTNLIDLIKHLENDRLRQGDTGAGMPHWSKTGQGLWPGLVPHMPGLKVGPEPTLGHLTAGYGLNLEREWPEEFWDHVLEWHLQEAVQAAIKYDWFVALSGRQRWNKDPKRDSYPTIYTYLLHECSARQAVIIALIYEDMQGRMPGGLDKLNVFIGYLNDAPKLDDPGLRGEYYDNASQCLRNSPWAKANEAKAQVLAEMMWMGEWPQ